MRTLDDLNPEGKRVLVRVDFNDPLDGHQRITDDLRIRAALPTLEELRSRGARQLILAAHLGRPKDREPELSLKPAAERLSELLGVDVALASRLENLPDVGVVMLENVRYEPGETKTIHGWPSAMPHSPMSTSTTPSARRTAPTPLPRQ